MAGKSDGEVVIKIDVDSKSFKRQMDSAAQSADDLGRKAISMNGAMGKSSAASSQLGTEISKLSRAAAGLSLNVEDAAAAAKLFENNSSGGADSGDQLNRALEQNARTSKELASEMKSVTSAYDKNDSSQEKLAAQASVLTRQINAQKERVALLSSAYVQSKENLNDLAEAAKKSIEANGASSDEAKRAVAAYDAQAAAVSRAKIQVNEAKTTLNGMERQMGELSNSSSQAGNDINDFGDSAEQSAVKTQKLGDQAEKAQKRLKDIAKYSAASTAALVAMGAAAVNVSTKFDAAFAKTQTIMDTMAMSAQDMRQDILNLSTASGMAATDVSEAVYQAISGSVATADAANFVSQANQLSVAGFTSLSNATDVLTTALNAYGLSADQVTGISNVLIQTQNLGKTSVDELSASMGKAISTGSAYGVNLENLSTAYVELTKGGIATAEATTYLSGMLNELGKSSSNVGKVLQEKTGKSFGQLMQDGWTLADVLDVLMQSVDGNSEALMQLWSSQEAGKAANALAVQGFDDFNSVLGQMEREMNGATSTTKDAYEIMTNTSEFVDTRFKTALTNLGVAAGDQLRPALDAVKRGLTDVLEVGANIINSNPTIVAGIAGVATATGTLAVAIGGLTVAQKAKAAMDALNISMAANPALFIASAVAGLAVAIGTLCAQSDEAKVSVDELTASSRAFGETIGAASAEADDTIASVIGTADAARNYVDRLAELEAQGLQTAAAQEEYRMTVDALHALMPELNLAIDEQTGLVEGGTDAIYDHIQALKDQAVAEAMQKQYKEAIEAWAEAQAELYKNQAKLSMLEKDEIPLLDRLAANREQQADINAKLNDVMNDSSLSYEEARAKMAEYNQQLDKLTTEEGELSQALRDNTDQQHAYGDAVAEGKATLDENQAAVDDMTHAWEEYKNSLGDTSGQQAQTEATQAQAEATAEYNQKLTDVQTALSTYSASFADAGIGITGFSEILAASGVSAGEAAAGIEDYRDRIINSTDEISQKSMADMETMIKNMQQRTETYKSWNSNLAKLQVQYGHQLSDDFLAFVRGLGPEYNGVLEEWLSGNTSSMTDLQDSVKDGAKTAVLCYEGEYKKLPSESERITKENVRKTMEAINPMADGFKETGATSGEELITSTQEAIGANLPELQNYTGSSGEDVGYQFSAGTATGIRNGEYLVVSAAQDVSRAAVREARRALQINSPSRVGEKEVGYWWPAGVAVGIEKGTGLLIGAVRTQFHELAHASKDLFESARVSTIYVPPTPAFWQDLRQPPAARSSAQLQATVEVPVYLDGREIARSTAHYMGEQMEFEVM